MRKIDNQLKLQKSGGWGSLSSERKVEYPGIQVNLPSPTDPLG